MPRFEWDEDKALANLRKHGVSFGEAKQVFDDPLELTERDALHSIDEDRWISIGATLNGRLVVVSYTERSDTIRIISARQPTRAEQQSYEEGNR